jgi:TatD DNase family protein
MLVDTHAHLDQEDFAEIRDEVIHKARVAGVATILAVGTTVSSSQVCLDLASQYEGVYAAVGIHPNYAAAAESCDWDVIERLALDSRVVAIGETGLDRHWDFTPFALQQEYFARHIDLAARVEKPFIVHMRDCEEDILAALRQAHGTYGPLAGVMHSFTGDATLAAECVSLGLHISFAGMLTFKKSAELRACAATIPADRLLVETDSPYLSPEPIRGQRPNEPANVAHTARCLADARGQSFEELAALTTANARRFFKIENR